MECQIANKFCTCTNSNAVEGYAKLCGGMVLEFEGAKYINFQIIRNSKIVRQASGVAEDSTIDIGNNKAFIYNKHPW